MSPVGGYTGQAHPQGIVAVVRGAEAAGTTAVCASNVWPGFEAAARVAKHPLIYQLYITADRKWAAERLDRVKAAGYRALCVTVDRNYYSRRERDLISGYVRGGAEDDQSHQANDTLVPEPVCLRTAPAARSRRELFFKDNALSRLQAGSVT